MFSYKVLIGSLIGIVVVVTGSYFALRKDDGAIMTELGTGEENWEGTNELDSVDGVQEGTSTSEISLDEENIDDAKPTESVPENTTTTPAPTPAPVPNTTPEPTPTPTPKPSGYSLTDISKHASAQSCWTAIGSNVYDLSAFVSKHPGGVRNILKICGIDGTKLFEAQHGGDSKPERILAQYKIGSFIK